MYLKVRVLKSVKIYTSVPDVQKDLLKTQINTTNIKMKYFQANNFFFMLYFKRVTDEANTGKIVYEF